jgi:hypothetical protein
MLIVVDHRKAATHEVCHSSPPPRLALPEASSTTINDPKVRSKKAEFRKMERALLKPGTGFGKTWNE